jgi:uncharacterized membrane protein YdjX (TVP38/TMEM64 family)
MAEFSTIGANGSDRDVFPEERTQTLKRTTYKAVRMILFVTACVLLVHFTPLKGLLADLDDVRASLESTGYWAPAVFFTIATVSIFVGAPRLPFCMLGGMLFGFVQGLLLSQVATLLGAYGPFLFARHSSGEFISKRLKRTDRFARYLDDPTVLNVFWIRQIPVWGAVTNLCLGSIGVSHGSFIVGSLLGFLPQAILFTLIGSGLVEESLLRALSQIWITVPFLLLAVFGFSRYTRSDDSPIPPTQSD